MENNAVINTAANTVANTVTVSNLNKKIANLFKSEKSLENICVKGEISNFTDHYKTGHLYFTLKDETSSVKAVMFKSNADRQAWLRDGNSDKNGMKVTVSGDVRVFERDGQYQLYAHEIHPEGMGALYVAFLELRERLEKEGLFSQKRELPKQPGVIAVITAETGAAVHDILNTLGRRNPLVKVKLFPALVQGENAPASLINALSRANSSGCDLIIIGRGGGSIEDLWAFNNEELARAIFASKTPTISAVGHEIDFTIADFVADLRACTPTAAAEISVLDISEVYNSLNAMKSDLRQRFNRRLELFSERTQAFEREIHAKSPLAKLEFYQSRIQAAENQIKNAVTTVISAKKQQLISEMKRIDALSPLNVLMRGYSIVTDKNGKAVVDTGNVHIGDSIGIKLHKGAITARVEGVV
jgi:exodeoxyribonuclease VII large subunit